MTCWTVPGLRDLKLSLVSPFQEAELERVKKVRELELVYARAQLQLEVSKAQQLADVEAKKFKEMTEALGPSTIRDLAVAGPEMQVRTETQEEGGCLPCAGEGKRQAHVGKCWLVWD